MSSMSDKPRRPYKNLEEMRLQECRLLSEKKMLDTTFYPCCKCGGYGWFRLEEDYDYIEGWKCAPRYKCEVCNQTGRGSKRDLAEKYRHEMAEYRKRLAAWKERDALVRSALNKLTKAERTALGVG